jgi:hypothetical protein
MLEWELRPKEVANLLNPAFCAILLRESVVGYQKETSRGMPYPLSFLILPIVLHAPSRNALPRTIAKKLHAWIEENQLARVRFVERVRSLVNHTKESIIFAFNGHILEISDIGLLTHIGRQPQMPWGDNSESYFCYKKAHFVGRWFGHSGDLATIFAIWGIKP